MGNEFSAEFFDDAFEAFLDAGMDAWEGQYTDGVIGSVPARVMRSSDWQRFGGLVEVGHNQTIVDIALADVANPKDGASLVFAGSTYRIDRQVAKEEGSHTSCVVTKQ